MNTQPTMTGISVLVASAAVIAMLAMSDIAEAGDWDWDDISAPYQQRLDTMTSSSGNAQRVNTVTHMATPWPKNVRNRHIPANAARMVGAIRRYEDGGKQRPPLLTKPEDWLTEMSVETPAERNTRSATSSGAPSAIRGLGNIGGGSPTAAPTANMERGKSENVASPGAAEQ